MRKINDKLLSWASIMDPQTEEQAKMTATMPFIYPYVALMPDAHLGRGSTVGSVIPTLGVVLPSAVGVDIGCFVGETKIPLIDGTQATLKELTNRTEPFWVYSCKNGRVVPGRAIALKTRENAELIRVVVSGGDEIICTPDHQFLMKDGTYVEAKDLKFNDSLMPLYRSWQTRDGYERSSTGRGNGALTHKMIYEHFHGTLPEGWVVHHDNHNHFDNRPENLIGMTQEEHSKYHREVGRKFDNSDPAFQEKRINGIRKSMTDPEMRALKADVGTKNITRYMAERPDHFKYAVSGNGNRGAPFLIKANTSEKTCDDCGHVSKNLSAHRWHKVREHGLEAQTNHKVVSVERLDRREDVYCLQVEEYHNFALSAGVFVHNCGMCAVRTQFTKEDIAGKDLKNLREQIERAVPSSMGNENRKILPSAQARINVLEKLASESGFDPDTYHSRWRQQLGTLGSGNHFIEVCLDETDRVWLFLHSGSRGVGNKIAQHHIGVAQRYCERHWISLPRNEDGKEEKDLAYLVEGTAEFERYVTELHWAQEFARHNRDEMMDRVVRQLSYWMGGTNGPILVAEEMRVNTHHNYTEKERHHGRDVWLTRKGAVDAQEGKWGLIPGSMGTRSYVVRGKGNKVALCSAPHGAGRKHSRNKARTLFKIDDLRKRMEGIEFRDSESLIDEIPDAYKEIDTVMQDAADLVEIVHTLRQIVNVKGD